MCVSVIQNQTVDCLSMFLFVSNSGIPFGSFLPLTSGGFGHIAGKLTIVIDRLIVNQSIPKVKVVGISLLQFANQLFF